MNPNGYHLLLLLDYSLCCRFLCIVFRMWDQTFNFIVLFSHEPLSLTPNKIRHLGRFLRKMYSRRVGYNNSQHPKGSHFRDKLTPVNITNLTKPLPTPQTNKTKNSPQTNKQTPKYYLWLFQQNFFNFATHTAA